MDPDALNAPRYKLVAGEGAFHEVWSVALSDPRTGTGLWLRYALDRMPAGSLHPTLWASWFDRTRPDRMVCLRCRFGASALQDRPGSAVAFGGAALSSSGCSGELHGNERSLRWHLSFEAPAQCGEALAPHFWGSVAFHPGVGFVLPHPVMLVTGALELDGKLLDLRDLPGGQTHSWGRQRFRRWSWARCSAFQEDREASIDLLSMEGPGNMDVPLFTFRYRGQVHAFGALPWILRSTSIPAAPTWHFAAEDATVALDGVVRAKESTMVQVPYEESGNRRLCCIHSEVASMELTVRTRVLPGASWRSEGVLRATNGAGVEFCGRCPDPRVARWMDEANEV